ncbi:hypothetical protein Salat_2514800 [Sesamum alatum]|uniref:CCHC-type domain-containing protein n=1 Tax=Sesamum alatum TaxID=300844 RepID=A0AAE1XSR1_9LAMI|nr:hypothetical protein Salat_2514800 [Sesamum alatum]
MADEHSLPGGETITVSFTYEKLPTFCYGCGVLGHIMRDCTQWLEQGKGPGDESDLPYGAWLRETRAVGGISATRGGGWGYGGRGWGANRFGAASDMGVRWGESIFEAPAMVAKGRNLETRQAGSPTRKEGRRGGGQDIDEVEEWRENVGKGAKIVGSGAGGLGREGDEIGGLGWGDGLREGEGVGQDGCGPELVAQRERGRDLG